MSAPVAVPVHAAGPHPDGRIRSASDYIGPGPRSAAPSSSSSLPRVSIVIPVYNAERYLDECLKSALDQTYSDIEVVVVDDGSTDTSPEILKGYADRIHVFRKPNGGTASALNYGYRRMRGDWFKWLSADDLLKPHAVETLCREVDALGAVSKRCIFYADHGFIDEAGKSITTVEHSGHEFIDEHGKRITTLQCLSADYNHMSNFKRNVILLHHFYGHGITSMFHRSIFDECGPFDESLLFSEDYEFWLRCCVLHGYSMRYVPGDIADNRIHASQLSSTRRTEFIENGERIRKGILDQLPADIRARYVSEVARYNPTPIHLRIRRGARDAALGVLSPSLADGAVRYYLRLRGKAPAA